MTKYIITIPVETDMDPSELLDYAMEFGKDLQSSSGEKVVQDEDETAVQTVS